MLGPCPPLEKWAPGTNRHSMFPDGERNPGKRVAAAARLAEVTAKTQSTSRIRTGRLFTGPDYALLRSTPTDG